MSRFSQVRRSIKRDEVIRGRHVGYIGHAREVLCIEGDILYQDGNYFYGAIDGQLYPNLEGREDFLFLRRKLRGE